VQLTLNGRSIGIKRLADAQEGVLNWDVPYEPGVLKAIGSSNGKQTAEFELRTFEKASRIELLPDVTQLNAAGQNICQVEYRIVDAHGERVVDADSPLTFTIQGPARILGLGNADLNSIEDCRGLAHKAYQGRGLAILRATAAGEITVTASSPGLESATLTLTSR
jgi:beta-galactosidase